MEWEFLSECAISCSLPTTFIMIVCPTTTCDIFITQSSYSANAIMVNDNTIDGLTFNGIYRIETNIISDVTDEENTKETEADEEMVASCEAIEKSDNDSRFNQQ